jgi:acyl-CoA thioesterase II
VSALTVEQFLSLLELEELDRDLYRGARKPDGVGRVFGGPVIAQAAQRSVAPTRAARSRHANSMRPGEETVPIVYPVVRDFNGASFATPRVIALQKGGTHPQHERRVPAR